uniref:Uncharacterized protein n=1 Tax=Arundo donax TaxID=35708 RepID=A0A0A9ENX9_ARUDO
MDRCVPRCFAEVGDRREKEKTVGN